MNILLTQTVKGQILLTTSQPRNAYFKMDSEYFVQLSVFSCQESWILILIIIKLQLC